MRKCDKKRLKKVRYHENLCRAKRQVDDVADAMGFHTKDVTTEDLLNLVKSLSNKTVRTLANDSENLLSQFVGAAGKAQREELVRLIVSDQAERTLKLEEERKRG